jgi:hypothetical protein
MALKVKPKFWKLGDKTQGTVGWYTPLQNKSEIISDFSLVVWLVGWLVGRGWFFSNLPPTQRWTEPSL